VSGISKKKNLRERLKDKSFREAYVEGSVRAGLPHQIRAMRQVRNWSQQELAKRMKTSQSAVARLENPDNGKFNITTLLDAAAAFDVALLVKFVPFSRLLGERANLAPVAVNAVDFAHDDFESYSFKLYRPSMAGKTHYFTLRNNAPSQAPAVSFERNLGEYITANTDLLSFASGRRVLYEPPIANELQIASVPHSEDIVGVMYSHKNIGFASRSEKCHA